MARQLLHLRGEQIAQPRIAKHVPPSLRQHRAHVAITLLTLELPFRFYKRSATHRSIPIQESVEVGSRASGMLLPEVDAGESALLPGSPPYHWQVEPPVEAVREHRQRYADAKGVAQQLLLMSVEIRACALHLDQDEIAPLSPEAVVHATAAAIRILGIDFIQIRSVPAERPEDGIHRRLTCRCLAAL